MNIHEYQAKEIFEKFGVPTPNSGVASTAEEAKEIADEILGATEFMKMEIELSASNLGKSNVFIHIKFFYIPNINSIINFC